MFDKKLGVDIFRQPYIYPQGHLRKMISWATADLFCDPLEFLPKMKNYIFRRSTRYPSVLTNSVINALRKLFPNYLHLSAFNTDFKVTVTRASYSRSGVDQLQFFKKNLKIYLMSFSIEQKH